MCNCENCRAISALKSSMTTEKRKFKEYQNEMREIFRCFSRLRLVLAMVIAVSVIGFLWIDADDTNRIIVTGLYIYAVVYVTQWVALHSIGKKIRASAAKYKALGQEMKVKKLFREDSGLSMNGKGLEGLAETLKKMFSKKSEPKEGDEEYQNKITELVDLFIRDGVGEVVSRRSILWFLNSTPLGFDELRGLVELVNAKDVVQYRQGIALKFQMGASIPEIARYLESAFNIEKKTSNESN